MTNGDPGPGSNTLKSSSRSKHTDDQNSSSIESIPLTNDNNELANPDTLNGNK